MQCTGGLAAHGAGAHLVRCEDRLRLCHTRRAVLFADKAARTVGSAQMPGALNLFVHGTHGLVRGADRSAAARALHHLVHAHGLVRAPLAMAQTRRAQSAAPLGRVRPTLLRMTVAHHPAATAAGFQTRGTRWMLALGADTFMCRAMHHAARRALARVLLAGRLLVYAACGDTVICAEVRRAHGAARSAGVTSAMTLVPLPLSGTERGPGGEDLVHAKHQLRRRTAARRAGQNPARRSGHRPLRFASRSANCAATWSSARAPVARSMTALSITDSSTTEPARSTTRASSRPTVCVASWDLRRRAVPSRMGTVRSKSCGVRRAACG